MEGRAIFFNPYGTPPPERFLKVQVRDSRINSFLTFNALLKLIGIIMWAIPVRQAAVILSQ